jgi:hypothetical protein
MTDDGDTPKNEFSNFLEDIAEEISQRVESLAPVQRPERGGERTFSEDRHIIDWPNVADRMIDEMR